MSIKILIVGPAASGKTTLANKLKDKGFRVAKLHTTRPKRSEDDDEYFFTKPIVDDVIASCTFNGWEYSLKFISFLYNDVFIVGPKMAQMIKDKAPEYKYLTVFLDVPESVRYERLKQRDMPGDSVIARMGRDRADFAHFTEYDIRIHENHEGQPTVIAGVIKFLNEYPC
jgi:guanylate kinase